MYLKLGRGRNAYTEIQKERDYQTNLEVSRRIILKRILEKHN
jgi:hypothetical protein